MSATAPGCVATDADTVVWYGALAALLTHGMDAVMHAEWRLLFVLRALPESTAYAVFVVLHLPLIVAFLWLGHHPRDAVRLGFRLALAAFVVVHAGLHTYLSGEPLHTFGGALSPGLIHGAALLGIVYTLLRARAARAGWS